MKKFIITSSCLFLLLISQFSNRILFIRFSLMLNLFVILLLIIFIILFLKKIKIIKQLEDGIMVVSITLSFLQLISITFISYVVVSGVSMENTFKDEDIVLVNYSKNINRFDVVVVSENNSLYLKRVVGLPNETISFINDDLYVDGLLIEEDFKIGVTCVDSCEFVVKRGEYFLLGDNRSNSIDSRVSSFGNKGGDAIVGKVY